MTASDSTFLDDLFDRAAEAFAAGEEFDLERALAGHAPLRDRERGLAQEAVGHARALYTARLERSPEVPGYTIERELGRGSMGVVYLARQHALAGRRVDLKVLSLGELGSGRGRRRFLTEARAMARLHHPHVVPVFDVVESEGWLAYAMEWVEGTSLAHAIRAAGKAPDVSRTVGVGVALARALSAVHAEGLLHRDVKPSNVLLRADGSPVLIDFGLVKDRESSLRTRDGAFLGTLAYAAPEQIRGEELTARADVYGLGATLYHALTRSLPFEGTNSVQVLRSAETVGAVPLRRLDPHLPRDLETVVSKAMDPEARRRYTDAKELADDLERVLALRPVFARRAGPLERAARAVRRNARVAIGVLTGVALSLLALLVVFGMRAREESTRRRAAELGRDARVVLLETRPDRRLAAARTGITPSSGLVGDAARRAVALYSEALELVPGLPQFLAERAGAERASTFLLSETFSREDVTDRDPLPTDPLALRSLGVETYCRGDLSRAVEVWERLEETLADDPFVQGMLGHVYLAAEQPALAHTRLQQACAAFPAAATLWLASAEAALRCGDVGAAGAVLAHVRELPVPRDDLARVEARWRLLTGEEAGVEHLNALELAELAEAEGDLDAALLAYVNLTGLVQGTLREERNLLRCARTWWDWRSPGEQRATLLAATEGAVMPFGSALCLLISVERARARLRSRSGPATLFTIDAEGIDLDPSIGRDEPTPRSIDALARRARVESLDLERLAGLSRSLRERLVSLWLDPDLGDALEAFVRTHGLLLEPGLAAFGTRPIDPSGALEMVAPVEPVALIGSSFFRVPLSSAGDLNGDGVPDGLLHTAEGWPGSRSSSALRAVSGADGSTLWSAQLGDAYDAAGSSHALVDDLDGDGVRDLIVPRFRASEATPVLLRAGADGGSLGAWSLPPGNDDSGAFVAAVSRRGGASWCAVAQPRHDAGGVKRGRVLVLTRSGEVRAVVEGRVDGGRFGAGLVEVGDLDGDGTSELAAGSEPIDAGRATVEVFSGHDGTRRFVFGGEADDFGWRARPGWAGDVDGDGTPDVAVGCYPPHLGTGFMGRVVVYSGRDGTPLFDRSGRVPHGGFGEDVYGLGDLDGDGRGELAITSWGTRSLRQPRVEIYHAGGRLLAELPSYWRLRRLGVGPFARSEPAGPARFVALRLGSWSRYSGRPLGGESTASLLQWR